jgi:hypothetical protein
MTVVAIVADKALAGEIYHVSQENTSLTPISSLPISTSLTPISMMHEYPYQPPE